MAKKYNEQLKKIKLKRVGSVNPVKQALNRQERRRLAKRLKTDFLPQYNGPVFREKLVTVTDENGISHIAKNYEPIEID